MRIAQLALIAVLSTACITLRVDIPDDMEFAKTPQGTWKLSKPNAAPVVVSSPVSGHSSPIVKAPTKKSTKARKPVKPTAEICAAKRAEADKCDAEVKVETCKTACEPPPAAPAAP
jgi:hypothetical protein